MKVSIITVCFNSAKTIEETIRSVLNQSYDSIEYIVIDGVSNDNTLEIVNRFQNQISHIISEPDEGMYDAINKGIGLASGELIGVLNADDFYIDNEVITDIVNRLKQTNSDAIYSDLYYVDEEDTNKVIRYWKSNPFKRSKFLYGWMPPHPTFFVKKSVYDQYGLFNLSLRTAADYELMLRFLYKNEVKTSYLNRVIVRMRVGGMSNTSLKNRINANKEDRKAWNINGIKPYPFTLFLKPLRKITQFLIK